MPSIKVVRGRFNRRGTETRRNPLGLGWRRFKRCRLNEIADGVIGAAIEGHRALGPGWLESAYVQCLCHELHLRNNLPFRRELSLPVNYKGLKLDCGYRVDMLVADTVVVEVKAVERRLLVNFNVPVLRDGIVRRVLGLVE